MAILQRASLVASQEWHTGAAQSDAAFLTAEEVDWVNRTIGYSRKRLKSRSGIGIV